MCFQKDGVISHTANVTINLLETKFGERVITRNDPVDWPPRSFDLTPLDYFPVKSMVCANKPAAIDELRTNFELDIPAVSSKIVFSVWTSASVPMVAMQKKSSFIHNGIERTLTGIKNCIHIQNRFCFN